MVGDKSLLFHPFRSKKTRAPLRNGGPTGATRQLRAERTRQPQAQIE